MKHRNRWRESEPVRLYLYGLLAPAAAVALVYGIVSAEEAAVWTALIGTVLGVPAVEGVRARVSPVQHK